jgi:small subunit ribosomal protein S3
MLDVREVDDPFLDAQVVANNITKSIERGGFYKKVANYYIDEIMKAGAAGVQIRIGGRLGGEKSRFQKFKKGYIKHSGYYADNLVDKGKAIAITKPGVVGVQVKILKEIPEGEFKIIEEEKKEEKVEKVEDKGNEKTKA